MKIRVVPAVVCASLFSLPLMTASLASYAGSVSADLAKELAGHAPSDEVSVIVAFSGKVDTRQFRDTDRKVRHAKMERAHREKADRDQKPVRDFVSRTGGKRAKQLWLNNEFAITVHVKDIEELARQPGVSSVRLDAAVLAQTTVPTSGSPVEWNLNALHVQDVWALGYSGSGVVVASMDTGVDVQHPDLLNTWRGGTNSWFDPHNEHTTPYDALGHGTQAAGIIVGGNLNGAAIGVAPGARWIATKLYNDAGLALYSDIHQSFQWLLDPDGNPDTADQPDIVNASWGLLGTQGKCVTEFANDIQLLKTAGIAVVFAGGNDGPNAYTSESPANNTGSFSVGAVDDTLTVANFSSRGASACDGSIFPKMTAPGVNINTTDLSFGGLPLYVTVTGTSFAAPHISGAMALLRSAFPQADVATLENALAQSAVDLGAVGADNDYGYGFVDVLAAYNLLANGQPPVNHAPAISSAPLTAATEGSPYVYQVLATDQDGDGLSYALDSAPAGMAIDALSGLISWTPSSAQARLTFAVTVRVTDTGGLAATQSFSIAVAGLNRAPIAANDSYSIFAGGVLSIAAPGVLVNDTDPDGDVIVARLASAPTSGTLVFNSNGSFTYTPNLGFSGTDVFSYRVNDGTLDSNLATATITVGANKAPVAKGDNGTSRLRKPVTVNVLANDFDSDGSLNPATVMIESAPTRGSVLVNANGSVTYTPKTGFVGTDSFKYSVRDNYGAKSNIAKVAVEVK
ncbi:MAG: S8 family serine peptidase [Gammaproteobacteria bacterium]|nr:S8 family serine peptidase [Gammaproteobacteria bacterium]